MSTAKEMAPAEFIVFAACTMLLTALGIDIMLPAFGAVRDNFNLGEDSTAAAQIIAFFFMGQIGQIIYGSLSDRFGRLAILKTGFLLYIGGGIAAVVAPSLGWMYAARFVAGMGAAALWVSTIACVRDRFVEDRTDVAPREGAQTGASDTSIARRSKGGYCHEQERRIDMRKVLVSEFLTLMASWKRRKSGTRSL